MRKMSVKPLSELTGHADPFGFQQLNHVVTEPINWLWKPYIPRGALTLVMGDGGYGKSWLTCALAADLSAGRALPGQDAEPPQRVLMIGAEDGLSQVVKPKLELMGATQENIQASDKGFTLDANAMVHLVRHIKEYDAAIVFLDPLVVYMGGGIDMFRANEARSMLTLLSTVAQDTNTAIVAVHHVRKLTAGSLQNRVMGSADFINGVRSGLMVDVSKAGQRYMAHVKSNWAANGPTLAYSFGDQGFQWMGEYSGSIDESIEITTTKRGAAAAFLQTVLKDGPISAVEMVKLYTDAGFNEKVIARAKRGVAVSRHNGQYWEWHLLGTDERDYDTKIPGVKGGDQLSGGSDSPATFARPSAEELLRAIGRGTHPLKAEPVLQPPPVGPNVLDPGVLAAARARLAAKRLGEVA